MAIGVLIYGKSGAGKSCSLRNFGKDEVSLIQVEKKPLPYIGGFTKTIQTDNYNRIMTLLNKTTSKVVVIDDAGYLQTNTFMRGHSENKGSSKVFDFYNDIADQFWKLLHLIPELPEETIVYVIMHEETDDFGNIKTKTIGKLVDKACVEGMFTIAFRAMQKDGEYVFSTKTTGMDIAKTPLGMFETDYIPNDLKAIDKKIREYEKARKEAINGMDK